MKEVLYGSLLFWRIFEAFFFMFAKEHDKLISLRNDVFGRK